MKSLIIGKDNPWCKPWMTERSELGKKHAAVIREETMTHLIKDPFAFR